MPMSGALTSLFYQVAEEDSGGLGAACIYVAVIFIIVLIIAAFFYVYQRTIGRWNAQPRHCKYCGKIVEVMSECCHARVAEKFPYNICKSCKKECGIICSRCKKPIYELKK